MSKTVEEIGLIVGGLTLAVFSGPIGLIALQGSLATFHALLAIGLTTTLTGIGLALRPTNNPVGSANTITVGSGATARRFLYGQFETAGICTYSSFPPSQNQSTTNQYLHLVYTLVGHEITSFDAVVINGTFYNFGTDLIYGPGGVDTLWHLYPGSNPSYNDFYWQHVFFEFDFGRPSNTTQPFPNLAGADSSWTSACLQRGCAKVHVILRADSGWPALFPSGQIPNIQFLVTGKKILDPRIQTAWQPSTGYVQYQWALDSFGRIWVQTNASGTSGAGPASPLIYVSSPTTVSDGTCSWTSYGETQVATDEDPSTNPQGNLVNGRLMNDGWLAAAGYVANEIIEAPFGYLQIATNAGTTGTSEPAFSTTRGGTTTDNTQDWVCLGRSWHAINPSNSALVVNDYLQDTDYGMKAPANTIDVSSVMAAANVCEEQALTVWNSDNTVVYENIYSCAGLFDFTSKRGDVLSSMLASMAGYAVPPGDLWHIFAGGFQTPTVAIGDSDLRGPIKGDFRLSQRELVNTMGASYIPAFLPANPAATATMTQMPGIWQQQPAPEYQANGMAGKPNYLNSEDGGQILRQKLQLDCVTSIWQAQRLEKIALMRTRFPQTITLPCKITALQLEAGDTFSWTHMRWGILGQIFEVTQAGILLDTAGKSSGDAPALGVDIIAKQTDPSIFEFQGPTSASDFGEYSPYGITGVMTGVE